VRDVAVAGLLRRLLPGSRASRGCEEGETQKETASDARSHDDCSDEVIGRLRSGAAIRQQPTGAGCG
jgi:hypothetical protein